MGVALVAALGLAACGGGDPVSKAEWEERSSAISTELVASMRLSLETPTQRREAAPLIADAMREAAAEMDDIEPPEEIAEDHDRYVDALRRCADNFEDALEQDADAAEIQEDIVELACLKQMQQAVAAIGRKGYKTHDPLG